MVGSDALAALRRLDTDGHLALSLYLDVSTPDMRRRVMERITKALAPFLAADSSLPPEQAQGLREDLEMVRIYFGTSASCRHPYVAIFSCAPQLFWRVVPLDAPVQEAVMVGKSFDTRALVEALGAPRPVPNRRTDLLPHLTCASV